MGLWIVCEFSNASPFCSAMHLFIFSIQWQSTVSWVLIPIVLLQALDKIRFEGLTDKGKLESQPELYIHIVPDKTNNTIAIIDSGIGMTKAGKDFLTSSFS